jgi:peptidoglycan glycosyltransferase
MNDVMKRLTAANPVTDIDGPPMGDVWDKLDALGDGARLGRRPRAVGANRGWAVGLAFAATLIVVAVVALPLLATPHRERGAAGANHPGVPRAPAASTSSTSPERGAQQLARTALGGHSGSVVALDPRTGAILAAVGHSRVASAPEATVDVLTAALALDQGTITPATLIPAPPRLPRTLVQNTEAAGFPAMTVTRALTSSVNTVFGRLGQELGAPLLKSYFRRFGIRPDPTADAAALASGQGGLVASPLEMATVAATVADDGLLISPGAGTGHPVTRRVMSVATARVISEAMRRVVLQGTATPAAADGAPVAGKTGTAPLGDGGSLDWFIGFAPAAHPTVAVAVLVRDARSGYGGTVAAPIAARFLTAFLQR